MTDRRLPPSRGGAGRPPFPAGGVPRPRPIGGHRVPPGFPWPVRPVLPGWPFGPAGPGVGRDPRASASNPPDGPGSTGGPGRGDGPGGAGGYGPTGGSSSYGPYGDSRSTGEAPPDAPGSTGASGSPGQPGPDHPAAAPVGGFDGGGPAGGDPAGGDPAGGDPAGGDPSGGATPVDGLDETVDEAVEAEAASELAGLARERDDYRDALVRLQADFENYKKRMLKQQTEHLERAAEGLVDKLLPVLDALDGALAHGGGEDVKQITGLFVSTLEREGLDRIDAPGVPFDPTVHEAVAHEPGDGGPQEVAEVFRAGYRWKGRLLRAAMVRVRG